MNNFQTILVAIFLAFFVFAVLIFSGILKIGGSSSQSATPVGRVVIWGTFKSSTDLNKVFEDVNGANKDLTVIYEPKGEATYEQDLIEAFAAGKGPDLFMITPAMIKRFGDFVYKIPYTNYAQKTFRDAFIDGAGVYLATDGVIGLPVIVDPMVLYYNKDILANEGIVSPPQHWDELFGLSDRLTKKKNDGTILQSMIALGRFDNITHAKDILATLMIQSGNPIISTTPTGYVPVLNDNPSSLPTPPVEQIVNFFLEFSNPSDSVYSWNRSLQNSTDMFTGGKLVMYLGRASELFNIQSTNPNLSFDVTQILQTKGTNTKRTYAQMYALAANKLSTNVTASIGVAGIMSSGDNAKNLAAALSLPPASRELLKVRPADPYMFTFFNSAIVARTWADPNTTASDAIFGEMIQNALSNKLSVPDAINKAQSQLVSVMRK